jgi:hypothetical protein
MKITSPRSARLDQVGWSAAAGSQLIRFYHRLDIKEAVGTLGRYQEGQRFEQCWDQSFWSRPTD